MKRIMEAARQRGTAAADRMQTAYQHLLAIAKATVRQAQRVGPMLRTQTTQAAQRVVVAVDHLVPLAYQVVTQTTRRVLPREAVPASEKLVSLFEPHTAIIRKGKPGHPTEFGRVIWLDEVEGGLIRRYAVLEGNPAEEAQLPPSLDHHLQVFKHPPLSREAPLSPPSAVGRDRTHSRAVSSHPPVVTVHAAFTAHGGRLGGLFTLVSFLTTLVRIPIP
jgi:transposase, IS5 family